MSREPGGDDEPGYRLGGVDHRQRVGREIDQPCPRARDLGAAGDGQHVRDERDEVAHVSAAERLRGPRLPGDDPPSVKRSRPPTSWRPAQSALATPKTWSSDGGSGSDCTTETDPDRQRQIEAERREQGGRVDARRDDHALGGDEPRRGRNAGRPDRRRPRWPARRHLRGSSRRGAARSRRTRGSLSRDRRAHRSRNTTLRARAATAPGATARTAALSGRKSRSRPCARWLSTMPRMMSTSSGVRASRRLPPRR